MQMLPSPWHHFLQQWNKSWREREEKAEKSFGDLNPFPKVFFPPRLLAELDGTKNPAPSSYVTEMEMSRISRVSSRESDF